MKTYDMLVTDKRVLYRAIYELAFNGLWFKVEPRAENESHYDVFVRDENDNRKMLYRLVNPTIRTTKVKVEAARQAIIDTINSAFDSDGTAIEELCIAQYPMTRGGAAVIDADCGDDDITLTYELPHDPSPVLSRKRKSARKAG